MEILRMSEAVSSINLAILSLASSASEETIKLGAFNTPGEADGSLVFVVDNQGGVRVIVISDPENSNEIRSYYSSDAIRNLVISYPGEIEAASPIDEYLDRGFHKIELKGTDYPQVLTLSLSYPLER